MSAQVTYLNSDGARYWYDTQPTVTKLADDRAEQLKSDPHKVTEEIKRRLDQDTRQRGDFSRVHVFPASSADVPEDPEVRLVVLGTDCPYRSAGILPAKGGRDARTTEAGNPALMVVKAMLENRGSSPRLYRNAVVYLAIDKSRLADLDEAVRRYLAWESILAEKEELDLSPHQQRQAATQRDAAHGAINARLPESYQWLLVPTQPSPQGEIEWQALRLTGQDSLAVRASRKMKNDGLLNVIFAPALLRLELDRIPLWRGNHVEVKQLAEDFARYIYLPRPRDASVLLDAIAEGPGQLLWMNDTFAYAEGYDEQNQRYRGLKGGQRITLHPENLTGLLVKPDVALRQIDSERPVPTPGQPEVRNGYRSNRSRRMNSNRLLTRSEPVSAQNTN